MKEIRDNKTKGDGIDRVCCCFYFKNVLVYPPRKMVSNPPGKVLSKC